ncbi:MAG: PLP-dependent aminotransferase family protein [Ruminococcus sp.]|nr:MULTISPECIES: PLP-dependent aminotransferase family protein [Ruminococcus]MCI6504804.1 PLP-dependent aminotransferase family protein [Ruminococcus sp.]MDD6531265.1 PLP-dependent aminotransferase family protein [Ruminococcus sp.]MDD6710096.1 PLP-dependent aminotransferase family protein [Ruminococcus sp.]MDY3662656.1 PLP-dependent aminotransferase family protein [Ruminococcus bovis]
MEYSFSDRVQALKPSAIREIFKYAADPEVVSLSAGNPSPEAFPIEEIKEISARLLEENPIGVLQYSVTEGYPQLRETLKEYMKSHHNVGKDFDDILITTGAQQIMDLATKSLVNEGDVVITEAPSFIGSLNTFRSYNAKLVGVNIDDDGMNMEELEKALKTHKNARFIYTIPNFQNPSGITMSLEKRKKIYELAKKYNVLILEDNPYGDLRYSGEYIPCIKSFDDEGIVLYAGSMSKVISPGIRVAYVIAPKPIFQKMVVCKQGNDVHTNIWSQMVCNELMTKYDFDAHLEKLRKLYSKKAQFMMDLMDKYLVPMGITYAKITGGLFTMCTLPDYVDMQEFCKDAIKNKVCVVPGNAFLTDESEECHTFRVNFSTPTDEQLEKGIKLLAKTAEKYIK